MPSLSAFTYTMAAEFDVESVLAKLTIPDKIKLLTGLVQLIPHFGSRT
jgi:hypothetical protein